MLRRLVLAVALLGIQVTSGSVIIQKNAESVMPLDPPKRWSWTDCGSPDDLIEVKSIEVKPDPPKPGQDLEITAKGYVKETLEVSLVIPRGCCEFPNDGIMFDALLQEGTYADVLVKVGLIKLLQKRFDVCEEARNANATIQCPVEPGDYTVVQTVQLPKEIPPAKFNVHVNVYNVDDASAVCVTVLVDFTLHPGKGLGLW
ncbi:Phosphatidylglycerol/phosphatidylinositol transfer protein [Serendipita sp. 399]|nr:Phosphatidylglycerol/phosphatidylinositol transfer protein [Serendipita sp. 399]